MVGVFAAVAGCLLLLVLFCLGVVCFACVCCCVCCCPSSLLCVCCCWCCCCLAVVFDSLLFDVIYNVLFGCGSCNVCLCALCFVRVLVSVVWFAFVCVWVRLCLFVFVL